MKNEAYNMDCVEYMRTLPDKAFDLAIADPPYGLIEAGVQTRGGAGKLKGRILNESEKKFDRWDKAPQQEFFDELFRVSKNVIIWGGNYFNLPPSRCVVAWDKCQPWPNFSQIEMAWTSFDYPAKLYKFDNRTTDKIHPTQKPVDLYAWCLRAFAHEGDKIFDPMMGSQSSRIAAYMMGFDYVGCEIDEEYFSKGCERFNRECKGEFTLPDGKVVKQPTLFD
jgi:site-specific DNA-methyltransferase (adenine-specific)